MVKKWMKRAVALTLTVLMAFGLSACEKVETPSFIKEYLCVEHTYGEGEVTRWATCAREGRVKYVCTECGHAKYESIYTVDHTPYTVEAKAPTCAEEGYTEHTACGVCGKALEGKEMIARLSCDKANQTYASLGLWDCSICKRKTTLWPETVLSSSSTSFSFGLWHRCYYKLKNSSGALIFRANNAILSPLGYVTLESGMKTAIRSLTIPFSPEHDWVAAGNIILETTTGSEVTAFASDLRMAKGADYAEVKFKNNNTTLSGSVIDLVGATFTVTMTSNSYKVYYATTNSAKMVRIVDDKSSTYLYGSTPLGV